MGPLCRSTKEAGSVNFHALWGGPFLAVLGVRARDAPGGFGASSGLEFFVADENKRRSMASSVGGERN